MNKILKISINDIIIDPARESEMISKACTRKIHMRPTGLCQSGETLLVILEENTQSEDYTYVLAPLSSTNIDEIIGEISARYFAGFSMLGAFDVKSEKWALFEKKLN